MTLLSGLVIHVNEVTSIGSHFASLSKYLVNMREHAIQSGGFGSSTKSKLFFLIEKINFFLTGLAIAIADISNQVKQPT